MPDHSHAAIHEAGHAVVALAMGWRVRSVVVRRNGSGRVLYLSNRTDHPKYKPPFHRCIVTLAGNMAERLLLQEDEPDLASDIFDREGWEGLTDYPSYADDIPTACLEADKVASRELPPRSTPIRIQARIAEVLSRAEGWLSDNMRHLADPICALAQQLDLASPRVIPGARVATILEGPIAQLMRQGKWPPPPL